MMVYWFILRRQKHLLLKWRLRSMLDLARILTVVSTCSFAFNKGLQLNHFQVAAGRYIPVTTGFMIHRSAKFLLQSLRSWQ